MSVEVDFLPADRQPRNKQNYSDLLNICDQARLGILLKNQIADLL